MAIYELVVQSRLFGEIIINRFHYASQEGSPSPSAAELATEFLTTVKPAWLDVVGTVFVMEKVTTRDLYNTVDFSESFIIAPNAGTRAGDVAPSVLSVDLRSPRLRTGRGRWHKFIAGISEADLGNNAWNIAPNLRQAFEAALALPLEGEGSPSNVYDPVLLFLEKYQPDPVAQPQRFSYRYFQIEQQQRLNMAVLPSVQYHRINALNRRQADT